MTDVRPEDVQRLAANGRIRPEPRSEVETLDRWVRIVLEALDHPEAYVTDGSTIDSFFDSSNPDADIDGDLGVEWLSKVSRTLRIPVFGSDRIMDLARRLRARR